MLLSLTIYSVPWTNGYSFAVNEQTKNRLPAMSDLRPVSRGFIREASFWERCLSGPFEEFKRAPEGELCYSDERAL